jgi:hypothetical protein
VPFAAREYARRRLFSESNLFFAGDNEVDTGDYAPKTSTDHHVTVSALTPDVQKARRAAPEVSDLVR